MNIFKDQQTKSRKAHEGQENKKMKIKVQIADRTGDTTQMMEPSQARQAVEEHRSHWLFLNSEMVLPQQTEKIDWDGVQSVRLMSPIVGGYGEEGL